MQAWSTVLETFNSFVFVLYLLIRNADALSHIYAETENSKGFTKHCTTWLQKHLQINDNPLQNGIQ